MHNFLSVYENIIDDKSDWCMLKDLKISLSFYAQVYLHLIEGRVFCNEGGEKTDVDQNACLELLRS